jgi:choline dehydrogenase-like flavoprotein
VGPHANGQCYSHKVIDENSVVVIGTGPPGAVATLQLLRAGVDVTLLEAGTPDAARGFTATVAGLTAMRLHRSLLTRSEGVTATGDPKAILFEDVSPGGLTNHWSCAVPRFSPEDFRDARCAGEAFAWPVEYDELSGWYDRVEPLLAIAGAATDVPQLAAGKVRRVLRLEKSWAPVVEAARLEGQGLMPIPYTYGSMTTLTPSGTVFNSFVRLVKPELGSRHLAVRHGAHVTRLEWSGASKRVTAVLYRDTRTGADQRVPCRAVVVAAGAINTAKLLLQSSDADFPDGLGNEHGVLGRYLHDHPLGKVEIDLSAPLSFQPPAYLTRAPIERSQPLYAAACLQWGGSKMLFRSLLSGHVGRDTSAGFNVFGTMAPSEGNYVALDSGKRSTNGTPALILHIRHPPESAQTLCAARDRLVCLLDRAGFGARVRKWVIDPVGSSVHYAGTCRMHASPKFGMLDRWSRLHAVPNVVVADSAAFTTGPEKNPVLTAMALAARASQRLADDLRNGVV